jgi:hypothetical protein
VSVVVDRQFLFLAFTLNKQNLMLYMLYSLPLLTKSGNPFITRLADLHLPEAIFRTNLHYGKNVAAKRMSNLLRPM